MANGRDRAGARASAAPTANADYGLTYHVGAATVARAKGIVQHGAVLVVQKTDYGTLVATVMGSRPWPYQTQVRFTTGHGRVRYFESSCDCPMELDCKHGVAALLQYLTSAAGSENAPGSVLNVVDAPRPQPERATVSPPPAWERSLGRLLGSASPQGEDLIQLGLQFDVTVADPQNLCSPVHLAVRPIQLNTRGRWVTAGVSWRELRYAPGRYVPEQLEALQALGDVQIRRNPWETQPTWVVLGEVRGPSVWDLLDRAEAVGMVFARRGRDDGDIELSTEPAEATIDVVRAPGLTVTPKIRLGGRELPPSRVRLVGDPAHGLVSWPDSPIGQPGRLVVARLGRGLSRELGQLIASGRIPVPEQDESRFFGQFVPRLRRFLTVESSDGSVPIPDRPAPRPVICVHHRPEHRLDITVGWLDEESGRRRELTDRRGLPVAERTAISESIDRMVETGLLPGELVLIDDSGVTLRSECSLTGPETIDFLANVWPTLRGMPGVATEEHGTPVTYRSASGEPEVQITHDDSTVRDWFDLAVRVTIDDEAVPFELIFRALASDSNMIIMPSGTYFTLHGERWTVLRQLIEESRGLYDLPPGGVRIDRYTVGRWSELDETGLLGEQALAWRERILAIDPAVSSAESQLPSGLRAELRGYQAEGFEWLRSLYDNGVGGILADDMGLGKTVQALGLIAHARERGGSAGPFLVVAPTSVVPNWATEAERFTPGLRVATINEGGSRRGSSLELVVADADIVVTSYALFRLEFESYAALPWSGLILDEAQFVKNHLSKGFRCAKMLPVPFKLAVTGTPLENNLTELWALLSLTAPGLFPDLRRFVEYYRVPIERGRDRELLGQLRRRVRPFLLRRTKEEVATDLPPKQEQIIELDLSPRHRQIYQRHLQRERQKLLGLIQDDNALDANRFLILRSLTTLRQLSLDPSLIDDAYNDIPSTKLDVAIEHVTNIVGGGHRVLVFSQFTRFLGRAKDRLDALGIDHCLLDGKTRDRAGVIDRFRRGEAPVFLVSLKAGGFGLNLTEADYCILLDPWWNPAAEAQAIDRTHRIGQTKKVMVYRYVARATIEEKVMALKAGKATLFSDVLGKQDVDDEGLGSGRAALTAADIRDLIA